MVAPIIPALGMQRKERRVVSSTIESGWQSKILSETETKKYKGGICRGRKEGVKDINV